MSDHSLNEEDDELQLGSYKLEDEEELSPISPRENIEAESDISTDSSSTSRKQRKSPHTLLKHAPSRSPEESLSSGPAASENDQAEHYQRLLQEAEQSLSSRDVLIGMMQEQFKKIENLYKQSLDDTQDIRHKYCVTTQELNNLRTICRKYKEDLDILTKEQKENGSKKDLQKLQKEVDDWKTQYANLLKQVQVVEKEVKETVSKISEEIQVDFGENRDLQTDINILKDHSVSIKNYLQEQNRQMEFLVRKLQDIQQPNNIKKILEPEISTSEVITAKEPAGLNNHLKKFKTKSGQMHNKYAADEVPHQLTCSEKCDSEENTQSSNLINEMGNLKLEIEQLNNKNAQLQSEMQEIDKLKEEINKLNVQLCNDEGTVRFSFTSSPVDVKDSLVDNLKKENVHLRGELEVLKNIVTPPTDVTEDSSSQNESENSTASTNRSDSLQQARNRQASRVSFAVTPDHLEAELIELHQENSQLRLKIKNLQGDETGSNEMERLTVELVNLRRQLKQKEEEINQLKYDTEKITSRKNALTQEFQNANELLKSDYQELLEINNKLTHDLKMKTSGMYENKTSNQSSYEELKKDVGINTDYEEVYDRTKPEVNNKVQEPDTVAINDLNKNTSEIIKEAVVQSIYTEMEKFKATLCDNTECKMVGEENQKIKDELYGKTRQLETIRSDLQIKTALIIEKETIIQSKTSEIEQLKRKISENNVALQDVDKVKNELDIKMQEIFNNTTKIQDLQTTISILKANLAKATHENENNSKDLQSYKECKCKIQKLEAEMSKLADLKEKSTKENECLKSKINMMKNTLQQYREEAEFKKMENEKLRQKEDHMQSEMSVVRRNSNYIAREFQKEVENNKIALTEISKECKCIEKECQIKLNKANDENGELKKSLQQKDEQTKELINKINTITKELETSELLHRKHIHTCERSMSEIKYLFKNKEDELISAVHEVTQLQENLQILENENERLTKLLQKQENKEYDLVLKHGMELKILNENYNNEKTMNSDLNDFRNDIRKELHNLKIQLQDLLRNLEYKLKLLKKDLLSNNCDMPSSKKSVNEMLACIEKFNDSVLQQQPITQHNDNNSSTVETENYSYYYEETDDVVTEDNAETFPSTVTDCTNKTNATKSVQSPSFNSTTCKHSPECNQEVSSITIRELQIKREYLIQKLDSIDQKLNNPDYLSIIKILAPKCIASSDSVLTSLTKTSDKDSYCTCSQIIETETEDLHLQQKLYSEKITASSINDNRIHDDDKNENSCSTTCTYTENDLEIMQEMPSQEQNSTSSLENKSINENNCFECPYDSQLLIKELPELLTTSMTRDADDLEHQSQSQQPKLQDFQETSQLEMYAGKSYSETLLPTSISKEERNRDSLSDIAEEKQKDEAISSENTIESECSGCLAQYTISMESIGDVLSEKCGNTLKEIKQNSDDNASKSSNTVAQQYKKRVPTAIPVLVQNSQTRLNGKCPSKNMAKLKDGNILQTKSKVSDRSCHGLNLNSINQKPTVSRLSTEAKGITKSSCVCLKRNSSHSSDSSQLPASCKLPKNCACKKENSINCGAKSVKSCKCGNSSQDLKD